MMTDTTTSRREYLADTWLAVVIAAVSLFFVVHLWTNPAGSPVFGVSAGTLPIFSVTLIAILAVALLVQSLLAGREPRAAVPKAPPDEKETASWRPVALGVLCVVYVAVMPWLGYLSASALFIGILAYLFGNRRPLVVLLMMIVVPFALSFFFEKAMVIYLPASRLFG